MKDSFVVVALPALLVCAAGSLAYVLLGDEAAIATYVIGTVLMLLWP